MAAPEIADLLVRYALPSVGAVGGLAGTVIAVLAYRRAGSKERRELAAHDAEQRRAKIAERADEMVETAYVEALKGEPEGAGTAIYFPLDDDLTLKAELLLKKGDNRVQDVSIDRKNGVTIWVDVSGFPRLPLDR